MIESNNPEQKEKVENFEHLRYKIQVETMQGNNANTEEEKIILYVVFAVLFIMSIILISGHAPWLVAGYNTATKKEKENIDEKKLSRIVGVGILPISALVLTMALLIDTLSTFFIYIFVLFTLLDTVLMIVAANKYSRKR